MRCCEIIFQIGSKLPQIMLAFFSLVHLCEMLWTSKHFWIKLIHPWLILSFLMGLFMLSFHVVVGLIIHFEYYRVYSEAFLLRKLPVELKTYQQIDLFLQLVDLYWSIFWLLQVLVQYLLTERHRLYTEEAIVSIFWLYVIHIGFSIPLCWILYEISIKEKEKKTNRRDGANEKISVPNSIRTFIR